MPSRESLSSSPALQSWKLPHGHAVTLKPRTAGVLQVVSGRAWATLDVARHTPLADAGDHFVALGHDLPLRAGQRVVVLEDADEAGKDAERLEQEALQRAQVEDMSEKDVAREIKRLEKLMLEHARNLEFEQAARVRDQLSRLKDQAFGAHGGDSVAL